MSSLSPSRLSNQQIGREQPPEPKRFAGISSAASEEVLVVTLLLILVIFIRLPFFFPATLDWDESGYIMLGQGILDGFLPYDVVWESKPPLVYAFFAGAISLFGKTVVAVRFAGSLWLTAAAYLTYCSAYGLTSEKRASIAVAILFLTSASLLCPEVMTEILALVPLIGALLLLVRFGRAMTTCLFVGALLGTATMFRPNLSYLAAIVGFYIALYPPLISAPQLVARSLLYAAGGMAVVFSTSIPYLMQNRFELWFDNVFFVPLKISYAQPLFAHAGELALNAFGISGDLTFQLQILPIVWIGGFVGILLRFRQWGQLSQPARDQAAILLIFVIGSAASVFLTGLAFRHYLVQLIPCFAIFSSFVLTGQPTVTRRLVVESGIFLGILFILIFASSGRVVFHEYSLLAKRIMEHKSLSYGAEYDIARYLLQANIDQKPVFLLSDIIVYWFIGQYPLTRLSTHPSAISQQYLVTAVEGPDATTKSEMRRILSRKPAFIVKGSQIWYLKGEEVELLNDTIERDYLLVHEIDGREIYRRK